jgi:phosphate transport system permease protein
MNHTSNIDQAIFAKRKRANKIGLTLSMGAMLLGMIFLFWILSVLLIKGLSAIDWNLSLIHI